MPEADRGLEAESAAPGRAPEPRDWFRSSIGSRPADASTVPADTVPAEAGEGPDARPADGSKTAADVSIAPADADEVPQDSPAGKRARGGFFGLPPAVRPDVLTDAETIVLPQAVTSWPPVQNRPRAAVVAFVPRAKAGAIGQRPPAQAAGPELSDAAVADDATQILPLRRPSAQAAGPEPSGVAVAEDATLILPVIGKNRDIAPAPAARHDPGHDYQPTGRYRASRHVTRVSRLLLLIILSAQALMSLRLHNTAFEDEALYIYSGHMEIEHMLHGSALQGDYTSLFSGSPVLYPVVAAALDQVGGLALARALSLVEMLAVTTIVYSIARYLFNERVGLYAAGLFAVVESTIFLGNFATYDATCLCLLACSAWIMVYTSRCRWPVFLLAAPIAALAVAVKYAGLLFVPTIAVLPTLTAWPDRIRRVWLYPFAFLAAVAGVLYAALRLGGHAYLTAIQTTTTNRAQGATPVTTILLEAAEWGGVVFLMAVVGTIAYVRRVRTESGENIAPAGSRLRRAALGVVLTSTALLAPAYQAHLHTDVSFLKHIGFGLFFAAPIAGFGLARIVGDYVRRPHLGVAILSLALVLGLGQSEQLYHVWPDSRPFVSALSSYLKPHARYLVEVPEVPVYYLMGNPDAQPDQFTSTYFIAYYNDKGQQLTGPAGFTAAIDAKYFQVVAFNGEATPAIDGVLVKALENSHSYYLAAEIPLTDAFGPINYYIWVQGKKPSAPASPSGSRKNIHIAQ